MILAAAGFNFKRMINKWKASLYNFFEQYLFSFNSILKKIIPQNLINLGF